MNWAYHFVCEVHVDGVALVVLEQGAGVDHSIVDEPKGVALVVLEQGACVDHLVVDEPNCVCCGWERGLEVLRRAVRRSCMKVAIPGA